ncbi:transcription termination factor NusA [Oceanivirga miroungae]|uniref:Transcription termination/antitermination protein NusA n=1 Tax=Oceanivirga miroungae TaxID=1130046 RepID=A0A6I8M727_9FUSO|nr:transcription termination factor NusA [Oceanivirga miroungae]VWL85307.1 transcription elongation factor NusA [Oceanivirga miroungae]
MSARDQKLFLTALDQLVEEKGLDKEELFTAIETAMLAAYKKNFKESENAVVEINRKNGAITLKAQKKVVEDAVDVNTEISLENAKIYNKKAKIGDLIDIEVNASEFRRNAIQNAKQIVIQKVREHEKYTRFIKFKKIENSLVTALVKKMDENGNLYIELNDIEAIIPFKDLNPEDKFEQGDRISVYIGEVSEGSKFTKVEYSRRNEEFLKKLLEREIPEIANKDIEIKSIAREAGSRSKIAVYSSDPNLDVKGACIGRNSTRIQSILKELNGEKLDLVLWDEDERIFVKNALSPASIYSIEIVEIDNEKVANVEVNPDELSLAIGKKGQNSRLASKLCKLRINIKIDENDKVISEEE